MKWLLLLLLAGCASVPEPVIKTVEVKVAVPVSCLPAKLPERPVIQPNAALLAMGDADLVLELAAERTELIGYAAQIEAVLTACR
ncbi:MAG: hypothetical protein ACRD52_00790 [Candidatus Acidiferrales bacterium]